VAAEFSTDGSPPLLAFPQGFFGPQLRYIRRLLRLGGAR
jgi:hypothetical protein